MARTRRVKDMAEGVAYYHLMSRTNNKSFLFRNPSFKDSIVDALKRSAAFSGMELKAFVIMDNHFHIVVKVDRTRRCDTEKELIHRVSTLKGSDAAETLRLRWAKWRKTGRSLRVEADMAALRRRMYDISEFVKTFKEIITLRFKKRTEYVGSIWSGRFYSTLIQDGRYLETCKRYVYYNPLRAGIVKRAQDYHWGWMDTGVKIDAVPETVLCKRIVQIGKGKVFGDEDFVERMVSRFHDLFGDHRIRAHEIDRMGYVSHGYLSAAAAG